MIFVLISFNDLEKKKESREDLGTWNLLEDECTSLNYIQQHGYELSLRTDDVSRWHLKSHFNECWQFRKLIPPLGFQWTWFYGKLRSISGKFDAPRGVYGSDIACCLMYNTANSEFPMQIYDQNQIIFASQKQICHSIVWTFFFKELYQFPFFSFNLDFAKYQYVILVLCVKFSTRNSTRKNACMNSKDGIRKLHYKMRDCLVNKLRDTLRIHTTIRLLSLKTSEKTGRKLMSKTGFSYASAILYVL